MKELLFAAWVAIAMPAHSQEFTMRDFNPQPTEEFSRLQAIVVLPMADVANVIVGNDDCQLGFNDNELLELISTVDTYALLTSSEQGIDPDYNLDTQALLWSSKWDASSRVMRLRMCEPLVETAVSIRTAWES